MTSGLRALQQRLTRRRLALAAIVFLGLGYGTLIQSFSWNQSSHYALIRAIDHGKTTIDPYIGETGDKAFYKGHWYSARAPGLALYAEPPGTRACSPPMLPPGRGARLRSATPTR
jgi:hypothetical protein